MSTPLVGCYGKLPFFAEYLRVDAGDAVPDLVAKWIDEMHAHFTRHPDSEPADVPSTCVCIAHPIGSHVAAVVARESSDGLRRHPVALYAVEEDSTSGTPALLHAADPVWTILRELLQTDYADRESFLAALAAPELSERIRGPAGEDEDAGPPGAVGDRAVVWAELVGQQEDDARHAALNLLAIAEAQREATSPTEGVAISFPLPQKERMARIEACESWLHVLGRLAGPSTPTVAIFDEPGTLHTYFHPMGGDELAAGLRSLPEPPIDEIVDVWQELPAEGTATRKALDRLAFEPTTLDGLCESFEEVDGLRSSEAKP